MSDTPASLFPCYANVAQLGHKSTTGLVSEVTVAGVAMIRIDLAAVEGDARREPLPATWELVAPASLYGITPATEAEALAARLRQRPWLDVPAAPRLTGPVEDAEEIDVRHPGDCDCDDCIPA